MIPDASTMQTHDHQSSSSPRNSQRFPGFITELRQPNVFEVAVVYGITGWVILQAVLHAGDVLHFWPHMPDWLSYFFTFLGVLLPTFGGSIAGIRYFGDFERFSAISSVTAEKLQAVHTRIEQLLNADNSALDYGHVSDLAHATDDVVVSEIENWQAVFGGKHVTVPV